MLKSGSVFVLHVLEQCYDEITKAQLNYEHDVAYDQSRHDVVLFNPRLKLIVAWLNSFATYKKTASIAGRLTGT